MADKSQSQQQIELKPIPRQTIELFIEGTSELIMHNWDQKVFTQTEGKIKGEALQTRKTRNPQAEYEAAFYRLPDGRPGMPATAFKSAIVGACRILDNKDLPMVLAKTIIYVHGESDAQGKNMLVAIDGEPYMRMDMPRNANGNPDLRYRPGFPAWKTTLRITFYRISAEQLVNLVDLAGMCGVGDWRPSSPKSTSGTYGTFRVTGGGMLVSE